MNESERQATMHSMMEQLFGGMGADEKQQMIATMMGKMMEGIDMKAMMPGMMMGMMSGGGQSQGRMQNMMSGLPQGGGAPPMPEMMLKTMMPHCIGMMLPAIDPDQRGEVAATLLAAMVEKGTDGMSDDQKRSFLETLGSVLTPSA